MSLSSTILIVDDDTIHQTVTGAMVRKMGYPVLAAYDGQQAIDIFKQNENDIGCILLDIQMPLMNGIEVLRHLRKMGKQIGVVIVSGYLDEARREQLDPLGPRDYLKKPLEFDILLETLASCGSAGSSLG